ncbi:putative lipid phosphate phosphatase 3, chloroplastic [Brachypodium distachyon]|uniref:Phosphatidic acid phosphatase type 2/haloperoxidase domain-containing protein n=1 Tax=Brachypodium distachyon TaxID=15368 RepID=I1HBU2_BRADI|nr:putative lipid phosphate phosphatase 3, chloroplastic [Brachypodium distachyon]XP_014753896.1 putative lipid phosphate phosphatase 3, chloroplastic [Brachypodium distachyon]XP_014753897.1 putative lipid phosphate phosphatase 3, chloroplastic [Brachypodium distachyon]XP_024315311.1 putative lipid phosphate phosphatase 3, chloroplastic [Brachypodium distachyon]XP_024315312.1 putative lipid phosphate phosphatase 3, chloroplastic [Brachypodium distachyon]KQK02600.1 hypothetical protein BRADI_2g|eukprot:XP_003568296.1 putative lipid phosphate phosphatase 3, chloroplastic [Brachypodium distachyon]
MQESCVGSHTIQTHGARLARKHTHDWVVLILLAAAVLALHYAPSFARFVGKDMMTDIKYPVKQSTVPAWAVPIISILCPVVMFISLYVARRDVYDLHHATLGVLFAVLLTGALTDAIKNAVGRPRPDFFWRCFPDGMQLYDQVTGGVICHGEKSFLKDGHRSFPSGHTSWSFAGLGFLSLYLSGKIKAFDRKGHVAKLCIVILPLLLASLVGISRIDDYRHHWEDVVVGGLIGYIMAMLCYLHFFPPPHHHQGWGPYAYFDMLEELEAGNSNNAQHQQSAGGHHIGVTGQHHNGASRNFLESGSA